MRPLWMIVCNAWHASVPMKTGRYYFKSCARTHIQSTYTHNRYFKTFVHTACTQTQTNANTCLAMAMNWFETGGRRPMYYPRATICYLPLHHQSSFSRSTSRHRVTTWSSKRSYKHTHRKCETPDTRTHTQPRHHTRQRVYWQQVPKRNRIGSH